MERVASVNTLFGNCATNLKELEMASYESKEENAYFFEK